MKKSSYTEPDDSTGCQMKVASVGAGLLLLPLLGPFALLAASAIYGFTKTMATKDASKELDKIENGESEKIADTWLRNRQDGESEISVTFNPKSGPAAGFRRVHTFERGEE